ncbi:PepSY domain-containing protein [Dyadobacter sp. MSC1_007]|jgi:sulfite reductase (NADPH) flavoprotein alpha-component|uniref:PepSY domain-containing protein n=1 Tax=Dyadobacter sp. MSC1_007 TaxID=2909264 RepID=UPI00202DBD51|nr:PepSY domain-containing protein [Dyadobacter sp. MSC1_007]
MTISVWRYSHLALAVSSFILLTLASVTGILLSFQPISEKIRPFRADSFNEARLSQTLPLLRKQYAGISELTVDANQFVQIKGSDDNGKQILAYIDPQTGKILGTPEAKSAFFEWVTALHRSLFLHEAGRFFVGIAAFLLLLITISGTILIIQRQRGVKRFFTRIIRDNFAQYYHVVLGRLSLIPIFILALSGTYLSLERFGLVETEQIMSDVDFDKIRTSPEKNASDFEIFKKINLAEVRSVEFPFSEDSEDYYTLKLKDRELTVNQITGDILTEVKYPSAALLTELSLDLHTGRTNAIWAIILAIASANILFFIYSGFTITFKRRAGRVKNKYTAENSEFIILVGSENGATFGFANAIRQQLIAAGRSAYLTELNNYSVFPKASHIVVMTATYGLGNPPTNAVRFGSMLEKHAQPNPVRFSVVGFGSHGYPDYCKFAFEVDHILAKQNWAVPMLEIHTVNDKSPDEFDEWANTWAQHAEVPLTLATGLIQTPPEKARAFTVIDKTVVSGPGESFLIRLRPKQRAKFTSGDLLSIYPANDHRERQYSIGKVGKDIQLSVKLHENGLGSEYLYKLGTGDVINGHIVNNQHFHFPETTAPVIMVSNGTGIAPFLGMIDQQRAENTDCHLYCGFRDQASFALYRDAIGQNTADGKLAGLHVAYSREAEKQHVKHLLSRDEAFVAEVLGNQGAIMLCGSLSMQNDVIALLEGICMTRLGKSVSYYQSRGQVLMDCY